MRLLIPFVVLFLLCPAAAPQTRKELMTEYARRYRATDKRDVPAMLALADWCGEKKLKTYANLVYRKVLRLDPSNARANAGLGRVKVGDGAWNARGADAAVGDKVKVVDVKGTYLIVEPAYSSED